MTVAVERFEVVVDGGLLVGERCGSAGPLVVALHGGGSSAGYWDGPAPGQSFVRLALQRGFAVLALDRPGYGASGGADPATLRISQQVETLFDAIDAW